MNRQVIVTNQFRKDYKLAMKRGLKINLLDDIIRKLAHGEELSEKNRDHPLTGNWMQYRECHIQPDWLLVYRIEDNILVLTKSKTRSEIENGTRCGLPAKSVKSFTKPELMIYSHL